LIRRTGFKQPAINVLYIYPAEKNSLFRSVAILLYMANITDPISWRHSNQNMPCIAAANVPLQYEGNRFRQKQKCNELNCGNASNYSIGPDPWMA